MQVVTVRLDEDLVAELEAEAGERDVTRTEYIRDLLRNRERIRENTPENTRENTREYAGVDELEAGEPDAIATRPLSVGGPAPDVEPSERVRDALEASGWSEGETRQTRERNAGVAAWALEVLREAGEELRKGDFPLERLDDDRDTDFLWLRVARPAILAVAEETDAVAVGKNKQRYRWVGA